MKKIFSFWPIFLFLFLTIFIFRQYVFLGKVPFAGNLLVSFYEPWKSYSWGGYGSNGPANKPIAFDSLRIFYPLRSLTIDSLKNSQLPLWNPYDFAGNTQLATYQSAVFFPLTPLFILLPQIDAWSIIVFLQPFLATCFMYFFLRSLSLSKKASVIGSMAFGFSGGILVLSEESFMSVYSLMVLPLILLGLYNFFQNGKFRWFALFTLGIVSSILSGWFQSTFYVLILSFLWLVFLYIQKKRARYFLLSLGGFVIAFLISCMHLIPNVESYAYSARGTTDAKYLFDLYLLPVWHLITYFVPDFFGNPATYNYFDIGFYYEKILYIGVVGLFLGLVSFFTLKKVTEEWFFTISWVITVSLGLSLPTSWFVLYYLHLPFLSTILPSRVFLLSAFCLSVMCAYGMETLFNKSSRMSVLLASTFSILVFIIVWMFLFSQKAQNPLSHFATISYRNTFLPTALVAATIIGSIFFLFKKRYMQYIGFFLLVIVSIGSAIYFADKYLFFSDMTFTFPQTPIIAKLSQMSGNDRFWSFGDGYIERNFATYFHLQSPEGYDSFYIRSYGEFITASKNGGKFTADIPRADAQLTGVGKLSEIAANPSLLKTLNILGVKYLVAKINHEDEKFIQGDSEKLFRILWSDGKFVIYENEVAFPRSFFVDSYQVISSPEKQLSTIFSNSTDLSKTAILDRNPEIKRTNDLLNAHAVITSYKPQKVIITTTSNKTALLVLSDNNYPGWQVTVDGKEETILTVDHTFRSVVVPKGNHLVVFSYHPKSVIFGFVLSGIGILLFAVVGFTITRKKQKK